MPEKYELDYKTMYEQLMGMFDNTLALQNEYFEILSYISETAGKLSDMGKHLMHMSLVDQLLYLRAAKVMTELSIKLQEKYNFPTEETEEENDD